MTRDEKLSRLQDIVRDVLDKPTLVVTEKFSVSDCSEWDSVATVQIVLAVEAAFGIRAPTEVVANLRSVRQLLELIP